MAKGFITLDVTSANEAQSKWYGISYPLIFNWLMAETYQLKLCVLTYMTLRKVFTSHNSSSYLKLGKKERSKAEYGFTSSDYCWTGTLQEVVGHEGVQLQEVAMAYCLWTVLVEVSVLCCCDDALRTDLDGYISQSWPHHMTLERDIT